MIHIVFMSIKVLNNCESHPKHSLSISKTIIYAIYLNMMIKVYCNTKRSSGLLVCEEKLELIRDFVTTIQNEAEDVAQTVKYIGSLCVENIYISYILRVTV